ncbi:hypothetical protein FRAAL6712 [Frankia alni ACN14a]|uniref:Uncharacterized protein n=1 Tax=Frankia alni (strain DSM 45986 / CECT 9034 / ACN14a) TaxID=326424 RepID=Q0RB53_FRAAA|nr:hypothetical protein FRAAL6712 [Frankia alni ACN14a]
MRPRDLTGSVTTGCSGGGPVCFGGRWPAVPAIARWRRCHRPITPVVVTRLSRFLVLDSRRTTAPEGDDEAAAMCRSLWLYVVFLRGFHN